MSLLDTLNEINTIKDDNEKVSRFLSLAVGAVSAQDLQSLDTILNYVVGEKVESVQVAKTCVQQLVHSLFDLNLDQLRAAGDKVLNVLKNFRGFYDEYDFQLRNKIFERCIGSGLFRQAAIVLSGAFIESVSYPLTDETKADIYIKCAECFLEIDESVDAETLVNRASSVMSNVNPATAVNLRFKTTFARVLDANRKFLEAALRYYDLSTTKILEIAREDLYALFAKAITCAILGKVCNQRNRILFILSKDERLEELRQMPNYRVQVDIFEKISRGQIIKPDEFTLFENGLMPHQQAVTVGGVTISQRTLMEHNVLAISNVYENIKIEDLGRILHLDALKAEKIAAKLIIDGVLQGMINQADGFIEFTPRAGGGVQTWNDSINTICAEVSDCADMVQRLYPNLADPL